MNGCVCVCVVVGSDEPRLRVDSGSCGVAAVDGRQLSSCRQHDGISSAAAVASQLSPAARLQVPRPAPLRQPPPDVPPTGYCSAESSFYYPRGPGGGGLLVDLSGSCQRSSSTFCAAAGLASGSEDDDDDGPVASSEEEENKPRIWSEMFLFN